MKNVCKKIILVFACLMVSYEYTACSGDAGTLYDQCNTSTTLYTYDGIAVVPITEMQPIYYPPFDPFAEGILNDNCYTSTADAQLCYVDDTDMLTEETVERESFMPTWHMDSSLEMAPQLFKGIFSYFQSLSHCNCILVPSFHRLILVGPPGSGKTTLAYAAGQKLNWPVGYIRASDLLGTYRNQTAVNIRAYFKQVGLQKETTIIIFDELHKLFELHDSELSDDSHNAAAFWLSLDELEKTNPNIIVIGVANSVSKLPAEIKSRFHGKIITMKAPSKKNKLQALINILDHDKTIEIDDDLRKDKAFVVDLLAQHEDFSLRDIQLLVDTAKMFRFAQTDQVKKCSRIVVGKKHFRQAMKQLKKETRESKKGIIDSAHPIIQKWGLFVATTINIITLFKMLQGDAQSIRSYVLSA